MIIMFSCYLPFETRFSNQYGPSLDPINHKENTFCVSRAASLFKVKSAYELVAHQAGTYPCSCNMKRLGVFLLPPGWDANP